MAPIMLNNPAKGFPITIIPSPATEPKGYFHDSDFYQIRKEYIAEVIYRPEEKMRRAGLLDKVTDELGGILLEAFNKTDKDTETFLGGSHFTKVAISVDYLVVIRKDGHPAAYGAGSFLTRTIFYFNSLMVRPKYQRVGLGFFASALLWQAARTYVNNHGLAEPDIVCRTHNRNVATGFLRLLRESDISNESGLSEHARGIFRETTKLLECPFDSETGISRNAYPDALPEGTKTSNERVNRAFNNLGSFDGLFITGKLNHGFVNDLLSENVRAIALESVEELKLAFT